MLIPAIVITMAVLMITCEILFTGRSWPKVRGWWLRAFTLNGIQVACAYLAGVSWDRWMSGVSIFDGAKLGVVWGTAVGYVTVTFVYYWWHRWRHESSFLWRWLHQVHHSPQRLEVITAFYKHPFELFTNCLFTSAIFYLVLGLDPESTAYATLILGLAELFYHWNVRTPYWVGFIIQRPESHCIHHQEALHRFNYGDLPIWDMLFGTFRNPKRFTGRCGFGGDQEQRLKEMLRGVDINAKEAEQCERK